MKPKQVFFDINLMFCNIHLSSFCSTILTRVERLALRGFRDVCSANKVIPRKSERSKRRDVYANIVMLTNKI